MAVAMVVLVVLGRIAITATPAVAAVRADTLVQEVMVKTPAGRVALMALVAVVAVVAKVLLQQVALVVAVVV
jgi:hypothetical protein